MRHQLRRVVAVALVLVLLGSPAVDAAGEYRTVEVEGLKITIDSEWAVRTAPGYLPVRFDLTNAGPDRVVDIVAQGTRFLSGFRPAGRGTTSLRQTVRLSRGDRVRITVPMPIFGDSENFRFEIQEAGETLERFSYVGLTSRVPAKDASALIVAAANSPLGVGAAGWRRVLKAPSGGGTGTRSMPPQDFILDPDRLPTNWLGFTSLRAVLIGPMEWQQLSDAQKNALLTWTACGGDLVFVDGDLKTLLPATGALAAPALGSPVRAYFFGRIHLPTSDGLGRAGLAAFISDADRLQDSNWALPANGAADWGAIAARGFRLLIPGVEGVPARAYLAILMLFTMLIGPVNYWFLRRKGQQVLLVLTTPLIAALFIVVLAGYVVAGEGWGVRGRTATFTMLDQARKHAATRASVSLYAAGMAPSGGLQFSRDAAIFPIGRDGRGARDLLALDLSDAQRFSSGVIQARSPTNFEQIGFRPARERLSFTRENGAIAVVNGLGVTVTALVYRDGQTIYRLARPLAAGAKDVLTAGPVDATQLVAPDLPQSVRFIHLLHNPPAGSYLAVLERSPFWEPGVERVSERGSFHLVIGWPEGQP